MSVFGPIESIDIQNSIKFILVLYFHFIFDNMAIFLFGGPTDEWLIMI